MSPQLTVPPNWSRFRILSSWRHNRWVLFNVPIRQIQTNVYAHQLMIMFWYFRVHTIVKYCNAPNSNVCLWILLPYCMLFMMRWVLRVHKVSKNSIKGESALVYNNQLKDQLVYCNLTTIRNNYYNYLPPRILLLILQELKNTYALDLICFANLWCKVMSG